MMLINNPEDFELKQPPILEKIDDSAICTFNRHVVPVQAVKADGNGAYNRKGASTRCFFFNGVACQSAHLEMNQVTNDHSYYINNRTSIDRTWTKQYVDKESIFHVRRYYRYNKLNAFNQMIVEVQKHDRAPLDYFYVLYRKNKDSIDNNDCEILMGRHGNAKNPHAGIYDDCVEFYTLMGVNFCKIFRKNLPKFIPEKYLF